ncbi:hypothetical protein KSP39_PZI002089 [Platanthera zijinensis]|uniref:Uncharacterized protein n=1 Tax=Platanthera zijinensis TaxID=2320716 RepID=A0AAP0BZ37_9ASPA
MAKKLFICFAINFALFLTFLSSFSTASSSQQRSKTRYLHPESQDASSWISGRKHLEEIIIHINQAGRFDQAKTGSVNGHENNREGKGKAEKKSDVEYVTLANSTQGEVKRRGEALRKELLPEFY